MRNTHYASTTANYGHMLARPRLSIVQLNQSTLIVGGILSILVLYAVAVSLITASQRSLWLDEAITAGQVRSMTHLLPTSVELSILLDDVHPPLYTLLLHLWSLLAGTGEVGLRSLSATWCGVAVIAMYATATAQFSRRSGLLVAALTAGSPLVIWYGAEARMYAQVFALSAVAGAVLLRVILRHHAKWFVLYGLVACGAAFTHYFAVTLIVVHVVFAIVYWLTSTRSVRCVLTWGLALFAATSPSALGLGTWIYVAFYRHARSLSATGAINTQSDVFSGTSSPINIYSAIDAWGAFRWGSQPKSGVARLIALWRLAMLILMLLL